MNHQEHHSALLGVGNRRVEEEVESKDDLASVIDPDDGADEGTHNSVQFP